MSAIRERVKEHFPMVLLTLLSIVQALALELLWSHVMDAGYLYELTPSSILSWTQIAIMFLGLILIWVVYASSTMRFRWVPTTSDSVYPFVIGVLEFTAVELLGPDERGPWLVVMAVIFGTMVRVNHKTMQRVRKDPDNAEVFSGLEPATFRDFIPHTVVVSALALSGIYVHFDDGATLFTPIAILATAGLLLWQLTVAARYWVRSVSGEGSADGQRVD